MKTIEQMNEIINWYRELPSDYTGINDIMYARIQLSTLLSSYATDMGEYRIAWKNAESDTERVKRNKTQEYMDLGFPLTKSQEYGKFCSIDQYVLEKRYDGTYGAMRLFYDTVNGILDAMNQHISNLKREAEEIKKQ